MNEKLNIDVKTLRPFTKFIYTIGELPTSYLVSMTYEEKLIWLCNYLTNTVIPTINNNGEAVKEVQDLVLKLQEYMNNYFDNLDVQQEINNKLDELVANGTLTNLIGNYINPLIDQQNSEIDKINTKVNASVNISPIAVNNISEMVDTNKIYVLTTDGKWYYYNGTDWSIGGDYQSAQISENQVKFFNLSKDLQKNIIAYTGINGNIKVTGKYISGNVGSEASEIVLSGYRYGELNVSYGDTILINFLLSVTYGNAPALLFVDNNNIIIKKYNVNELKGENAKIIDVPLTATKLYYNDMVGTNITGCLSPLKITNFNYIDNRLNNLTLLPNEITPNLVNNLLYSSLYWNYQFSSIKTYIYNVKAGDKYNVNSLIPSNYSYYGIIYSDDEFHPLGYTGKGNDNSITNLNEDIIIPSGATKIIICQLTGSPSPVVKKYSLDTNDNKKLNITYNNNTLNITNLENNNNLVFSNFGGNNLFMIQSYTINNTTINTSTDMIPAPYIVNAINNINGDRINEGFTGGNHQWNNTGTGSTPTAQQQSLSIFVDGKQLQSNTSITGEKIKIIETNLVQANNTCLQNGNGRNVLKETIIFEFDGKTLNVSNVIEPLEDIIIKTYYGIQTALFNNEQYKIYADIVRDVNTQYTCPIKPYAIIGNNIINAKMSDGGLGNYEFNKTTTKVSISNGKSYYVPIFENNIIFREGEKRYITGSYDFEENVNI